MQTSNMAKEIAEQSNIIRKILETHLQNNEITGFCNINNFEKICIIASGTSKNAANFGKYYFEQISKITTTVEYASEFIEKTPFFNEKDLVIFISQSGESKDVIEALLSTKKTNAFTIALVNNIDSTLAKEADWTLDLQAGKELAIPATKSFSATIVKLLLLSLKFAQNKNLQTPQDIDDLKRLPASIDNLLLSSKLPQIAKNFDAEIILGRGLNYFACKEISLKLKESAMITSMYYPLGEFIHGHMIMLTQIHSILAFSFNFDKIHPKNLEIIEKIKEKYTPKIQIIDENYFSLKSRYLTPLLAVIMFQAIGLILAEKKGINPDSPEGLSKVAT